jgi:hypothetical protein
MHMTKLSFLLSLTFIATAPADTVGHWRFDSGEAQADSQISVSENTANPGVHDAVSAGGAPLYSSDVPAGKIYDPVADVTLDNGFSMNAGAPNSRVRIADSEDFNTSFTLELFIKIVGEPNGYVAFARRQEAKDLGWQIDFDGNRNGLYYGRPRARWDTPAGGIPDNVADKAVDENVNFVVTTQGGKHAARVFIDTGAKDEGGADAGPQNTANVIDYIFNAASPNPSEQKASLQGDGINDDGRWHHLALTFDQDSGEVSYYFDYVLTHKKILSDSEENGYTHPAAFIDLGKLTNQPFGLLLDEVRYSRVILAPGQFLRVTGQEANPATIAHWRMDGVGARDEGPISMVSNEASPLRAVVRTTGEPLYSADVPGPIIVDPATDASFDNAFSFNAATAYSRLGSADDPAFNTSFTVEMFMKVSGEPKAYDSFMQRFEGNDLRWQIDFDHNRTGSYGRARTRWDTPAGGVSDNVAERDVDENFNFAVGPTGGINIPEQNRIFIDTDPGDGLVSSYDDETDWALDGDGVNDRDVWHHVAMTFDEESQEISFYFNYEKMQSRILQDTAANGYTHPAAGILFGKYQNTAYGLMFDEVRYSSGVLDPSLFLQAVDSVADPFEITGFKYNQEGNTFVIQWRSEPGVFYSVDRLNNTDRQWEELEDALIADGEVMEFEDTSLEEGRKKAIYRVRVSE